MFKLPFLTMITFCFCLTFLLFLIFCFENERIFSWYLWERDTNWINPLLFYIFEVWFFFSYNSSFCRHTNWEDLEKEGEDFPLVGKIWQPWCSLLCLSGEILIFCFSSVVEIFLHITVNWEKMQLSKHNRPLDSGLFLYNWVQAGLFKCPHLCFLMFMHFQGHILLKMYWR